MSSSEDLIRISKEGSDFYNSVSVSFLRCNRRPPESGESTEDMVEQQKKIPAPSKLPASFQPFENHRRR